MDVKKMGVWRWGLHSLTEEWQAAAYIAIKCQVPQSAEKVLTVLRPWKEFLWMEQMIMLGISHSSYCCITLQPPGQHQPIKVLATKSNRYQNMCEQKGREDSGIYWHTMKCKNLRNVEVWTCDLLLWPVHTYWH